MSTRAETPPPPDREWDRGDARLTRPVLLSALAAGATFMIIAGSLRGGSEMRMSRRGGKADSVDPQSSTRRVDRDAKSSAEPVAASASRHRESYRTSVSRQLACGASVLSFSVLADSAAEHYRAGLYNPGMYVAPIVSALTLLASGSIALRPRAGAPKHARLFGVAALVGLVGAGFHTYNVSRRIGGWTWENLFYGAPIAAPLGLTAAGLMGMAASRVSTVPDRRPSLLLGLPAGRVLSAGAAAGLLGTAAEAGLLHFRGAFHHPAMYLPVTVPPLAALALGATAVRPSAGWRGLARWLLRLTAGAGIGGMGFHARGIGRSMGGWRNWRQNLLAGPPLPAPPAFTGMALAGLGGLALLEAEGR